MADRKSIKLFWTCRQCIDDLKYLMGIHCNKPQKLNASERKLINCEQMPRCFDQPERVKKGE